jgi:WD40 repeat protein
VVASALWAAFQADAGQVEATAKSWNSTSTYGIFLSRGQASFANWGGGEDLLKDCSEHLRGWEWNYRRLPSPLAGIGPGSRRHQHQPTRVQRRWPVLAGPGLDNTVTVWNLAGNPDSSEGPRNRSGVAFRPNGRFLVSADKDGR